MRASTLACLLALAAGALAAEDILIADFEGEALGPGPARGTLEGQMHVSGFLGKGLVNTFYKGDGTVRLEILVDRTSIEVFGNDGRVYMPVHAIPPDGARSLALFAKGGSAKLISLEVFELDSAWQ